MPTRLHHLEEHVSVRVVHLNVDQAQEPLDLRQIQLVILVLIRFFQAVEDPAGKFLM